MLSNKLNFFVEIWKDVLSKKQTDAIYKWAVCLILNLFVLNIVCSFLLKRNCFVSFLKIYHNSFHRLSKEFQLMRSIYAK